MPPIDEESKKKKRDKKMKQDTSDPNQHAVHADLPGGSSSSTPSAYVEFLYRTGTAPLISSRVVLGVDRKGKPVSLLDDDDDA